MRIARSTLTRVSCPEKKIAELLDETQWADELSWSELRVLSEYIHPYWARKGAMIFSEGTVDRSMGILVKGEINITKTDGIHDRQNVIATLKPPQTFGEMSLIDSEPRSATAVAAGNALILFVSKDSFERLAKEQPALAYKVVWKIARLMSQRLRKTSGQLVEYLDQGR